MSNRDVSGGPARHESSPRPPRSGGARRATGETRYQGERGLGGEPLVVRRAGDDVAVLDLRRDLAPGLPLSFDWGPHGVRPRAQRLAVAILADALSWRADGDELALRHFREFEALVVCRESALWSDGWFEHGAWSVTRWISEREDTRQQATSRVRISQNRRRA